MRFFKNFAKPEGLYGKLVLQMMNHGHAKLAAWAFSIIGDLVTQDAQVLDIGCGGGANLAEWLRRCPEGYVSGLDYSALSVEKSSRVNHEAIAAQRCRVHQGNVADMPFADASFDLASAFETVYFWPDLVPCFREIMRVLRPSGYFFLITEADGSDPAQIKWTKMIDGMRLYTADELRAALEEAGFRNIRSQRSSQHWLCLSAQKPEKA